MILNSPLSVTLPRKKKDKKVILNLNNYRNLHYIVNNQAKVEYNNVMKEQLEGLKLQTPVTMNFTLYKASKRKSDKANVLSIIEKFFCDALVHYKCIPDDCDDYIDDQHYYLGGIDKENPRVEIEILEEI